MKSNFNISNSIIRFEHVYKQSIMVEEVRKLFLEYAQSLKIDLYFQNFETEVKVLPGKYGTPYGILILALVDNKAAGTIALRKISKNICEMKRLYVRDTYRKLGIGKKLVNIIIQEALRLNYSYMRLDTLEAMKKAQDLYVSFGFYDIEPYVYNPIKGTRFMELKLKD
ncbi:GNAT family N-acetyltransferase [Clostridium sp. BJN0013]|uniref:GNAT family N-acetyltransferase n=1 Tax=Clostridium sp. BJN0013 TaxID=3236840 RepID=UPI0034C5DFB6